MQGRAYDRLAAALSVGFLLVLGAGTYYLAAWASKDDTPSVQIKTNDPNVFVEGVSLTRTGTNGEPVFQMSAASMQHFPIDNSSEFIKPQLISLDPTRPKLVVRADRALASAKGEQTELSGNVVLVRRASASAQELVIRTDRLTLLADSEIARTDGPVQIEQGAARLSAVGMEFDNQTRNLVLHAQVRAIWPTDRLESKTPSKTE